MERLFTEPGIWSGGYYEMKLFLGSTSCSRIEGALTAFWTSPQVTGPYQSRDVEPAQQVRSEAPLSPEGHLYGTVMIRDGIETPCATYTHREEDRDGTRVADFVSFYIPLSALSRLYPVGGYPFGDHVSAASWRSQVDEWLLELLRGLNERLQFEVGVIGWEPELWAENIEEVKAATDDPNRFNGIVLRKAGEIRWYPATRFDIIKLPK